MPFWLGPNAVVVPDRTEGKGGGAVVFVRRRRNHPVSARIGRDQKNSERNPMPASVASWAAL
jgi:hypothetical protein